MPCPAPRHPVIDDDALRLLRRHLRPADEFVPSPAIHAPDDAPSAELSVLIEALAGAGLLRYADCYFTAMDGREVFVEVWVPHPDLLARLAATPVPAPA